MPEPLSLWIAAKAAGLVFKPILEEFAKDTGKDIAKDFFKDALKKVIHLPEQDAHIKALKEFLQLMEQELVNADCRAEQIREYIEPLKQFVRREDVAAVLASAFEPNCRSIDSRILDRAWAEITSPSLPDDFSWEQVWTPYRRAVKNIAIESEKLQKIYTAKAQINTAEGITDLVGITPEFDLRKYAEGLREQYGNLPIESLETNASQYKMKLKGIFVPQNVRKYQEDLSQMYELPKEHGQRWHSEGQLDEAEIAAAELQPKNQAYQSPVNCSILEIVTGNSPVQKVVVLGDPGAGKSSLLQYLALIWAELPTRDLAVTPIPLLVELRTYARDRQDGTCQDILTFLHGGNVTCRLDQQQLYDKLKAGHAIALFDGIDEIFDLALRYKVVTDILRFTTNYPHVRVIATSRRLGYKVQKLRDAGFQHFMLQDLEDEQIEDFIQRWHDLIFPVGADKECKRDRLQKALRESKSIRELAGNPLLLTMMAILNLHQELPRDRPELYSQASRVLLHQWDFERNLEDPQLKDWKIPLLDYKDKQGMLRKVAYHMQSSAKGLAGNIISATDLENILTDYLRGIIDSQHRMVARLMIDRLRHRNFILCDLGADSYAFVHRTFLEYFCAWEFTWQFKETQTLTAKQLKNEVFASHWQDESWHEVLRLISGMIDAKFVADIIDYLLSQQVDKSIYSQRETLLQQRSNGRKNKFNKYRREGLNRRNEEWIEKSNLFLAANCFDEVRNKQAISSVSTKLVKIIQYEINKDSYSPIGIDMATALMSLLANIWHDNHEVLPYLKKCLNTNSLAIRRAAIQSISQSWQNDPDTLQILRYHAANDKDLFIRSMSSTILIDNFKERIDASDIIKHNENNLPTHLTPVKISIQGHKNRDLMFDFLSRVAQHSSRTIDSSQVESKRTAEDRDLSIECWVKDMFCRHWQDEYWHEILLLISSVTDAKLMAEIIDYLLAQKVDKSVFLQKETLLDRKMKGRRTALNPPRRQKSKIRNEEWIEMSNLFLAAKCFAVVENKQTIDSTSIQLMRRIQSEIEKDSSYSIGTEMANELIYLLVTIWNNNHEILPYLEKCLTTSSSVVRCAIIQTTSKIKKDDSDMLRSLKHYQYDNNSGIQLTVSEDSDQSHKDRSQILEFLYNFVRGCDEKINTQQAALETIIKNYPDRSEVLDLLLDRSKNDPDEQVRKYAEEQSVIWRARTA